MTDLEKELTRQIHELNKELMALRERVAVVESRLYLVQPALQPYKDLYAPPFVVTCGSTGIAGRD